MKNLTNPTQIPPADLAVIAGFDPAMFYTQRDITLPRVHRNIRGKVVEYVFKGYAQETRIYRLRNVSEAKAELENRCRAMTAVGVPLDRAVAWLTRSFLLPRIERVAPGTSVKAVQCSGTYFGSGHYTATWDAGGAASQGEPVECDNGFARFTATAVTMHPGAWVLSRSSAYPGGSHHILYVC